MAYIWPLMVMSKAGEKGSNTNRDFFLTASPSLVHLSAAIIRKVYLKAENIAILQKEAQGFNAS